MAQAPRLDIQRAFIQPTINVAQRVEIYEQDGKTPWKQELWDDLLVSGNVSLDYDRDERRVVDLVLDNYTGLLSPEAGGFWYDKRLKVFYGIHLDQQDRNVRVAIIEETSSPGQSFELKAHLSAAGIREVHYLPSTTTYDQVADYDVVVGISATRLTKTALLTECFNRGKGVVTFSIDETTATLPLVIGNSDTGTGTPTDNKAYTKSDIADPMTAGYDDWTTVPAGAYRKILNAASGGKNFLILTDTRGTSVGGVSLELNGSRWVHVNQNKFNPEQFTSGYDAFSNFVARTVLWTNTFISYDWWEIQLGEFLMDSISSDESNGAIVNINGRDLTKLCMLSKFVASTTFKASTPIENVVKIVATNAGITKMKLPVTNKTLSKDTTWERDTSRWEVIRDVCNSNNCEVFFDNEGYLVVREYRDPLTSQPTLTLSEGELGNLVSRGAKTSDTKLFNHIVVVGESSDTNTPPVYAEAVNNKSGSYTSVDEIGDRVQVTTSSLVTNVSQAQDLANTLLSVSALEEFELGFSATLLPWIEVGDIIVMGETDSRYWGPDRFLLTSLSFPLDLTPMSGTGKRVEKVVDPA